MSSVASTDETTAVTMDACWADQKAASTDAPWVGQMDASTAAHSAARLAVRWVASTVVMWAAGMVRVWAAYSADRLDGLMVASKAETTAVRRDTLMVALMCLSHGFCF